MNFKYMLQKAALQSPYPEKQPSRRTKHQLKNLKGALGAVSPVPLFGIYHPRTLWFSWHSVGQPCLLFILN